MKKHKLLAFLIFFLFSENSFGDIIIVDLSIETCLRITNLDEFPEIEIIEVISNVFLPDEYSILKTGKCFKTPERYIELKFYAVRKDYIKNKELRCIDWEQDKNIYKSNEIELPPPYSEESDNMNYNEYSYKIIGFTDSSVVLHKWKEIKKFNYGQTNSTLTFDYKGDASKFSKNIPSEHLQGFYTGLKCTLDTNISVLNIKLSNDYKGEVKIKVFSSEGKIVKSFTANKKSQYLEFDFSLLWLKKGLYKVTTSMGVNVITNQIKIE